MKKQNNEKLSSKAFSSLILTALLGFLACLLCFGSTTFAWFSDSASYSSEPIKTADSCLLDIALTDETGAELTGVADGVTLQANKRYTLTLSLPKNSASGYAAIVTNGATYYTEYIARHDSDEDKKISFTLTVASDCVAVFETRWGIYADESKCAVKNGGTLEIQ